MSRNNSDTTDRFLHASLLASTAGALVLLALAGQAKAENECNPYYGNAKLCNANSYPNGINYNVSDSTTLILENPNMAVTGDVTLVTANSSSDLSILAAELSSVSGVLRLRTVDGRATITAETGELLQGIEIDSTGSGAMDFFISGNVNSGAIRTNIVDFPQGGDINFQMTGGTLHDHRQDPRQQYTVSLRTVGAVTATIDETSGPTLIDGGLAMMSNGAQNLQLESGSLSFVSMESGTSSVATLSGGTITPTLDKYVSSAPIHAAVYVAILNAEGQHEVNLEGTNIYLDADYWQGVTFFSQMRTGAMTTGTFNMSSGVIRGTAEYVSAFHYVANYNEAGSQVNATMSGGLIDIQGDNSAAFEFIPTPIGRFNLDISGGIVRTKSSPAIILGSVHENIARYPDIHLSITIGDAASVSVQDGSTVLLNTNDLTTTLVTVMTSGQVYGASMLGGGGSDFSLNGGTYAGNIYGDYDQLNGSPSDTKFPGNDRFTWSDGQFAGAFYGQGGSDQVILRANALQGGNANYLFDGGEADDGTITNQDFDQIEIGDINGQRLDATRVLNFEYMVVAESKLEITGSLYLDPAPNYPDKSGLLFIGSSEILYSTGTAVGAGIDLNANVTLEQSTLSVKGNGSLAISGIVHTTDSKIDMQDENPIGRITIRGSYIGSNASIAMDLDFSDGSSDRLIILGTVAGRTNMSFRGINQTAQGHKPYGFLVVETLSNTLKNAFGGTLTNGLVNYAVRFEEAANNNPAGFYLMPTSDLAYSDRFLDKNYVETATINELIDAGITLQPYVPLYEAYQSVLLEMTRLPSMKTRSGGRYDNGAALISGPALDAMWGRIGGDYDHFDPQSSTASYDYDLSVFEMQAGLDGLFLDNANGALVAGFNAHYRTGEAKIASRYGDSKIHPDGYGFGGTLTWFGANGFYADAQAALTWYSSALKADDLPLAPKDSDGFGYALSIEAGQAFAVGAGLALTPQAQLSFADVSIDGFTGAYSDDVSFSDGQSLLARAGLALEKESTWQDVNGQARAANVYGIANLYYEFLGETKARVVNLYDFTTDPDDFTGEIGFGGAFNWQAGKLQYSAFAELTASTGFDTGSYGYGGNIGLKLRW